MRLLTGIKPTGMPHLGNYVGAIRPALSMLKAYPQAHGWFFIADYHALIDQPKPELLREHILQVAAAWLAFGDVWRGDPLLSQGDRSAQATLYLQSDIPEIFELQWIFSCFTAKGLMNRAHAYKARVQDNRAAARDEDAGVNIGLYSYPVLMAADILVAHADCVPVGADQKQHVEIACDIATSINHAYNSSIFTVPEVHIREELSLMGLDGRKMSKSYGNHVPLFCEEKALRKYVMKIPTDSTPVNAPKKPEGTIMQWYEMVASEEEVVDLKKRYLEGIGWGEAKECLFEALREYFYEPSQRYQEWMSDPEGLRSYLGAGSEELRSLAQKTLIDVKKALGLPSQ